MKEEVQGARGPPMRLEWGPRWAASVVSQKSLGRTKAGG